MKDEQKKQKRKAYSKEGPAQTKVTFKLDNSLVSWLKSKANKGRYINDLIHRDVRRAWTGDDEHTDELEKADDWDP